MTISIGDKLPDVEFKVKTADGIEGRSTSDVFSGKTIAVFGIPGAFTPTCSGSHLPGYLSALGQFAEKGVDSIACISVNDAHVMKAWAEATDADGQILFLADGNAEFTKAAGLEFDAQAGGMGLRCVRFSMLVDDGIVKDLHIEPIPSQAIETSAEKLLTSL